MMKPYIKSTIAMIASSVSCIISDILTKKIEMETYTLLFLRFEISFLLLISYYLYINFNNFSSNKIFFILLNTVNLTITLFTLSNSNIAIFQIFLMLTIIIEYNKDKIRWINFNYFYYPIYLILYSLLFSFDCGSYKASKIHIFTLIIGILILKIIEKSKKQDLQLNFINKENLIRGLLFGIGMLFFLYGLKKLSLGIVILLNFATPIWTIILSKIFLKEELKHRLVTCLLNTFGIFLAIYPCIKTINVFAIFSIFAASFCFATIDVYNKYHLNDDSNILELLIGSSMISSIFFPIIMKIQNIPLIIIGTSNLILAIFIGITAILIPLFMLKASQYSDLSALQPLKYIEFPLSIISSYLFFNDIYTYHIFIGFFIITIGTSINYCKEIKDHSKI